MNITADQKTMLALAYCADLNLTGGDSKAAPDEVYRGILGGLQVMNGKIGAHWKLCWGPVIYSFSPPSVPSGREIDNLMFVAQDGTNPHYAVAIAGTDYKSLWDWILEDLLVKETKAWPCRNPPSPAPRVSLSTFIGLDILRHASPKGTTPLGQPFPGTGQTLLQFLASVPQDEPITVSTTGHSLGGALAPTLALYLKDELAQWNRSGNATVSPYAFAGPTPGDGAFAAYFQTQFPNGMSRIWNGLDIVPHAWDVPQLQEIPTLYGTPAVPKVANTVADLVKSVQKDDYAPLNDAPPAFSGPQQWGTPTTEDAFFKEAIYQHTLAYWIWGGIHDWHWPKPPKPRIPTG